MLVISLLLAAALVAATAFAVLAHRRGKRMVAAEDAVVALARSWSEDGTSRGRLCAAAQLVAGAEAVFLSEPTRRGDMLRVTAAVGAPELVGTERPLDPEASILARAFVFGEPLHVPKVADLAEDVRPGIDGRNIRSGHLRAVYKGDRPVGVLGIAWKRERVQLDPVKEELIAELAGEAARAIERDAHVALLHRQARTDELTALPNRRAWDEAVSREMSRAERTGEPLCVVLLDLDHFKRFNDEHGHQAGDAHLRRTASAWRRELREIDVLARYGGEEFGVLLPGSTLEEAREAIDRVRAATPNGQTASAGVVRFDGRESAESVQKRADEALYQAKGAGRATTVLA